MSDLRALSNELEALVERSARGVVSVRHRRGQGSGVVLANDGYIATNAHVVAAAQQQIAVRAGEDLRARLVGSDQQTDLAVLKVDTDPLDALSLSATEPRLGQLVVALGDPFRFERSVSVGIVSALDRTLRGRDGHGFEELLQTDAAINPGNSGGPLIDMEGNVVGINTAMLAFAQGIGFAIPASTVDWVVAVLIQRGRVDRPRLGIHARPEVVPRDLCESVAETTAARRALCVHQVQSGSPAGRAGLRPGDYLLSANGSPATSINQLHKMLVLGRPTAAELEILSGDGTLSRRVVSLTPNVQAA